jgi:hypothetical protein
MFPTLLLPWWFARANGAQPDSGFHRDLVYSSINGYYFIRLVDNLMDGHSSIEDKLLPAAAFFHTEFTQTYTRYFAPSHPFWKFFRKVWFRTNEAAVRGSFTTNFGMSAFTNITVAKLAAAQIPLAATAYRAGRPGLMRRWLTFCDLLAAWFQMMDDLFDWHRDLRLGQPSYVLSESARLKGRSESVEAWMVRGGFALGMGRLRTRLDQLQRASNNLGSTDIREFLVRQSSQLARDKKQLAAGLETLCRAGAILGLTRSKQDPQAIPRLPEYGGSV